MEPLPPDSRGLPEFASRLNRLLSMSTTIRGGRRVRWTNSALAEALTEAGCHTSESYLKRLRRGHSAGNPTGRLIYALCVVLDCPAAYFFDRRAAEAHDDRLRLERRRNPLGDSPLDVPPPP